MENNKAEFYKLFLTELQRKKTRNSPDANDFETRLFKLIGQDLDNSAKLGKIEDHVRRVARKFDVIDQESEKKAHFFYKDFPTSNQTLTDLKKSLVKNHALFDNAYKNENNILASKYSIIQLEGVLNYLEPQLIAFEEANPNRPFSQLKYISELNGNKRMQFMAKCNSSKDLLAINLDFVRVRVCYQIRNMESHELIGESKTEAERNYHLLMENPLEYYNAVLTFLKNCFITMPKPSV